MERVIYSFEFWLFSIHNIPLNLNQNDHSALIRIAKLALLDNLELVVESMCWA